MRRFIYNQLIMSSCVFMKFMRDIKRMMVRRLASSWKRNTNFSWGFAWWTFAIFISKRILSLNWEILDKLVEIYRDLEAKQKETGFPDLEIEINLASAIVTISSGKSEFIFPLTINDVNNQISKIDQGNVAEYLIEKAFQVLASHINRENLTEI